MNSKFDELAMAMAQSVTRRQALKRFSVGLAGMALACFGLANKAGAAQATCEKASSPCTSNADCCSGYCYPALTGGICGCGTDADCRGALGKICCFGLCSKRCYFP
jgi:hypothetical protein